MSYTSLNNPILGLESDTVAAVGKYLGYEYQMEQLPYIFRPLSLINLSIGAERGQNWMESDQSPFSLFSGRDILKFMGPISKEDYDYYENL